MTLRQLRIDKGLSQIECAKYLNIPHRSYCRYEADERKINPIKYNYIQQKLTEYNYIDEEHGILTIDQIKTISHDIFKEYSVEYCYLFGSYARNEATEKSDIDLLVSLPLDGLKFFELVEILREKLKKKIDLLDVSQLENNTALVQEILKDGLKIFG